MALVAMLDRVADPELISHVEDHGLPIVFSSSIAPVLCVRSSNQKLLDQMPTVRFSYQARRGVFGTTTVEYWPEYLPPLRNSDCDGSGISAGILDTGITASPGSRLRSATEKVKNFSNSGTVIDRNGHGTYVAEVLNYYAPAATLYIGKLGDKYPSESAMLQGLEWCHDSGVQVVNISGGFLRTAGECNGTCGVCRMVSELRSRGIIVVVAAGNKGPTEGTIYCPGNSLDAITVGTYDRRSRTVALSSSVGRLDQRKPDLLAEIPRARRGKGNSITGTSFASPVVAGIIAACLTNYSADSVTEALLATARDVGAPRNAQGAGCLDLEKALEVLQNEDHTASADPRQGGAG